MIMDCTGLILAGGESRRMGFDKATLEIGGSTLLQRSMDVLCNVFPKVLLSVRKKRRETSQPPSLQQVYDDPSMAGPLAGLHSGLSEAQTPWIFALAVDMPFITPEIVMRLAGWRSDCQAVVPVVEGYPQPLAAYYALDALPTVRMVLRGSGKHSLRAVLEQLSVCYVHAEELRLIDPELRGFADLDTPDDAAEAFKVNRTPLRNGPEGGN